MTMPSFLGRFKSWHRNRHVRRTVYVVAAVIVVVEGYITIAKRHNDFRWHYDMGANFLAGRAYEMHYLLGRAMMDSVLASMNYRLARALCYVGSLLALFYSLRKWQALANVRRPIRDELLWPAVVLSCGILLPFILRDLDECGLQIFLLAMLAAAGWALHEGRSIRAGVWLGIAATYKVTPLVLLVFLLWKRKWRPAAWMAVTVCILNLMPVVHRGWKMTIRDHRAWAARVHRYLTSTPEAYPSLPGAERPKPQNLSLGAALARYLESYPEGHPLHLDHPLFIQFGSLDAAAAKLVVKVLTLMLGAALAWRFRRRWGRRDGEGDLATEWAVACLFCALLSPICWKQHLVLALPCVFLAVRERLAFPSLQRRRRKVALWAIAAVVVLSRHGIVGRPNSILLMSYKFDTFAVLLSGWLAVTMPRRNQVEPDAAPGPDAQTATLAQGEAGRKPPGW